MKGEREEFTLFSSSPIFLDASSGHALKIYADMIQNQVTSTEELLVLENADTSLLSADYLSALFDIPMLLISCNPVISSLASCTASSFQLHDGPDREELNKLWRSIEDALYPGQHVVTLVANGGTGKTQTVLKFVSKNISR